MEPHKNIDDRVDAAKVLKTYIDNNVKNSIGMSNNIPIYIDFMDNQVNKAFGAYPERLYIIQDNVVHYQGKMGPMGYHLREVEDWIKNYIAFTCAS